MSNSKHFSVEQLSNVDLEAVPVDGGADFNRLIFEKSPYLLQHATNPIDWHPWNDDALDLARERDRPIFLSIGYSTCHWCHVMAEESFSDSSVAEILNENYIAIKVDREERPDIDSTYMQACQVMTGSGGWPLTLVLTPAQLPFFAATYIPKHDRHGMTGLISLLHQITNLWESDRQRIKSSGLQIYEILKKSEMNASPDDISVEKILGDALREYCNQYDSLFAGFGHSPKFPAPHNLSLLLKIGHILNDTDASEMALDTLRNIRLGGIYDQLGGGIHRYSVDERWLVPHFEKMLYDQSLLISAATDGWQCSGDVFYRDMALDTARYLDRSLTSPEGGFYCGEDADTEGEEGTSYLWSIDEIALHIPEELGNEIIRTFGITKAGNFEGRNILYLPEGLDNNLLEAARSKLLPVRNKRPQPHLDDKIITGWNGLTIAALSRLGALTAETEWIKKAEAAAIFIKNHLRSSDGRLLRRWRQGEAAVTAFLEDYAFLIWGLIELHQALFKKEHLQWALELTDEMHDLFSDGNGGLYDTGDDAEKILVRGRNLQDGATPSGNGTAAMVLARLGLITGRTDLSRQAEELLQANAKMIKRYPTAFSMSLTALSYLGNNAATLVISGRKNDRDEFLQVARSSNKPHLQIIVINKKDDELMQLAPIIQGKESVKNQATAWLCQGRNCQIPTNDPEQLAEQLK